MDVAHVVSALAVRPAGLNFVHRPHLVNVLGELVADALNVRRQSDLVRAKVNFFIVGFALKRLTVAVSTGSGTNAVSSSTGQGPDMTPLLRLPK